MRANGVRVVSQRKSWDCGVAALASLLCVPYGDVSALVKHIVENPKKRGLVVWHMEAIADQLGKPLRRVYRKRDYLKNATGILGLLGGKMDREGHWVVIKAGAIVDPDGGEVWEADTYLRYHRARPCTLLVLEET